MSDWFVVNRTSGRRVVDARRDCTEPWTVVRTVLVVCGVLAALAVVYALGTLILLVVFSLLFAYLIAPIVSFIQPHVSSLRSRGLDRGVAIFIAYLLVAGVIGLSAVVFGPSLLEQASQSAREAPERLASATATAEPVRAAYSRLGELGLSPALIEHAASVITGAIETAVGRVAAATVRVAAYLPWLVLIPIFAFFLLRDAAAFRRGAVGLVPAGDARIHADEVLNRIDAALAAFIRAQLVACLIVGAIVGIGLALLRVPYAATLGVAAGVLEFLPLVGPLVIAVVSAVVAAVHAPMLAVAVLVFLGVLRVVEDYVIYPRLVGSNMHLHPLAVIFAVLAGAELGGAVGVLLSVPVLATASATYRYFSAPSRASEARPA